MHDAEDATGTLATTAVRSQRTQCEDHEHERVRRLLAQAEELSDVTLSRLAPAQLIPALHQRLTQALRADFVALLVMKPDGQGLTLYCASGQGNDAARNDAPRTVHIPLGEGVTGHIAIHRKPLIIEDLETAAEVPPLMPEHARSLVGIPLEVEGRLVGVLHAGTFERRRFTASDVWLLELVGDRVANALVRLSLREEATTAHEHPAPQTSESRAAREAAGPSNNLATLVDALMDGVLICDRAGRVVHANRAFRELFGVARDTELAATTPEQQVALFHMRDAQGRHLVRSQIPVRSLLRGATLQGDNALGLRVRAVDGRELTVSVTGAPLRDTQGQIVGAVAIYRDVSMRREPQQRTQQAPEMLLEMVGTLTSLNPPSGPEAVGAVRQSDVLRRLAALTRQVLGCPRVLVAALESPELLIRPLVQLGWGRERGPLWHDGSSNTHLGDFLPTRLIEQLRAGQVVIHTLAQKAQRVVRGTLVGGPVAAGSRRVPGGNGENPGRHARPKGAERHTFLFAPIRLGDELVGVLGVDFGRGIHTRTESERTMAGALAQLAALGLQRDRLRREREESLAREMAVRDISAQLDEFIAVASHDLRQPVTGSTGYLQLALRHFDDLLTNELALIPNVAAKAAKVERDLVHANESMDRLYRLVNRLFDVARVRAGQFDVHVESADLVQIARTIIAEQRVSQNTHPINSRISPHLDVPVLADADRIGQVINNYIANAVRYSPPGRPITVTVTVHGDHARVAVRDRGRGIQPHELARIWARFERSDSIRGRAEGGLGLGLYISKQIVELHGGHVGVESTPGKGSCFWLTLPIAQRTAPTP